MLTRADKKHFHLWLPNIFGFKGGIQVYSAFFLQALQSLYPQSQYDVFLKLDVQTSADIAYLSETKFHFTGGYPQKIRTPAFVSRLITQGLLQNPDLVMTTHMNFTIAAYWLKRLRNIPYWTVAHGLEAWDIQNSALKTALHHADLILAVSGYTRDRLLKEQNLDPKKVVILPNTFDGSRFQPAPKPSYLLKKYQLKPEQPIILTVARLSEVEQYKGYDQILYALPKIRQLIPDVQYMIVGKGNDRIRLEKLIAELELQNCVTFAGFVPDEQLCDYYNLCDVFAMPSKREGFGIVYLEALACGKPVLGGNQDGSVDALCHGELGALVNPNDVEQIADTLSQIILKTYPNDLIFQPENLRQKVMNHFGFESFQKTFASYLDSHFPDDI
ncbi:glycosyltransferase [Fortiea contorta]|uniref:glycosyltransferase n=1 Tax=Fortiea contorta TaxID=1892405 RepID=UPI00058F09BC|nr:glycosyltransferase [Fortiea contorta]